MSESEPKLLFETQGSVAIATLNRPKKINALDGELFEALNDVLEQYARNDDLRCLIITGAGGNFSAGGDLKWLVEMHEKYDTPEKSWSYDFKAYHTLNKLSKPVISAMDGYCLASAFNLSVVFTDIRIASTRLKMGLPHPSRGMGIIPAYPQPWHHYTGLGNIMYLGLTGKQLSAEEALQMGLVNEVVEPEQLLPRAIELATIIAEGNPFEVAGYKEFWRTFPQMPGHSFEYVASGIRQRIALQREDLEEGKKAFLERRSASWEDKS